MEKERLQFCINRFDHYYDSVNSKGSVFLALGTFITGGLVAAYPYFLEKVDCTVWIHVLMSLLILLGLSKMIVVILASTPHLSKDSNSLFYFRSIDAMSKESFNQQSINYNEEAELADLRDQVLGLAAGLTGKFEKLKIAGHLFTIQFVLLIPLIILVIINTKDI